jgi:3-phenylpropionate/trans-cinnamate dioxygenase ferredoxin reductase subunit
MDTAHPAAHPTSAHLTPVHTTTDRTGTDPGAAGGVVIVGACQAGVQLAASLREYGWTDAITLLGAETHLPYQRPPLSKKALLDGVEPADLALRSEQFFVEQNIDLMLGERVTSIEVGRDGRGTAVTGSRRTVPFGRLALTVGARPRRLDLPGADLDGIYYLRDSNDALQLRRALTGTPKVVVIGGGFIGLEVAATARRLGCEVSVVLADDRLMARAVSPHVSEHVQAVHESQGVGVRCATMPVAYLPDVKGHVRAVELADGRVLGADVVVVGVGAVPRTELAEQLGLDVAGGIVVDEHALTSDGITVAAGDCTVWNGSVPGCTDQVVPGAAGRRFESVNAATEQAKVAAATIAGRPQPWASTPWFWSDQFDVKLQVAGTVPADGTTVLRQDPVAGTSGAGTPVASGTTVLHYVDDILVAVECINRPADFMAARSTITKGLTIDPHRASDATVPLKSLVADAGQPADSKEAVA